MEVLSAIVGAVIESIMVPIKRHMGYLISSTEYVNNTGMIMKALDGPSVDVKKRMESNEINNLETPHRVAGWLQEVEKIKEDVERISSGGNGCFNMKVRYQKARKALKITQDIERLIKENREMIWTDAPKPLGRVYTNKVFASASSSGDAQSDFKSRDRIFKKALEFLEQDQKAQVIALCGMGGVGKTTMMEQLKEVVTDKKMFKWVVKVVIGQTPNMFSIQQAIAEYVHIPLTETAISARADRLRIGFGVMLKEANSKILLILDDIWDIVELKDIGLSPFPNGFKLMLTSRFENICKQIAVGANSVPNVIRVDVLQEAEARDFFWKITGISKEDDPKCNQIGCEIVKRCGCLPLAVKLIATTLKFQEMFVWRNTLHRLKMNDLEKNVQEIIEISYNFLKGEEDKAIFLLCGLFPDDFNIPIEELARYAWGLKLLKGVQTFRDARDRTKTCVCYLKSANMLMDGDYVRCVKMHDLVLAFVLSSKKHAWIINHGDTSKWSGVEMTEHCERISATCTGMSEFPIAFKSSNVSLLKLMHGDKSLTFPGDFYGKVGNLEVIAYEKMHYPLLPRSFHCSTNLRMLSLHRCLLMFDLSVIGDLVNLEVLSFAHCGVRKLPFTIGNLKKLRLLDLTGCVDLHIDEGVLKKLGYLEEVYLKVSDKKGICFTDSNFDELAELSKNLFALEIEFNKNNAHAKNISFTKLERFKISIGLFLDEVMERDMHSFENTLVLETNRSELLESGVNELFEKTEVLHLKVRDMTDFEDVLVGLRHPLQDLFYNLRVLVVSECADLKYLFTISMANGLKKLEDLTVSKCPLVEALVYTQNRGDGVIEFPKLKSLSLHELPELVSLSEIVSVIELEIVSVIELPELVNLTLDGLPNFTSIYPDNESTSSSTNSNISSIRPFLNKKVVIPKLETLRIARMVKLKEIWPCQFNGSEEVNACIVREIHVDGCDSLTNLFPNNPMPLLHHLERLQVRNCGSIEVLFDIDLGCVGGEIDQRNSNLRSILVSNLRKLREIWRVKGVNTRTDLLVVSAFQAFESIRMDGCKSFRNMFTPTTITFDFRSLTYICIFSSGNNASGDELVESCQKTQTNVIISKEEISEEVVKDDNIPRGVAFPSHLMSHSFHHLRHLRLHGYIGGVDVLFEIESATNRSSVTTTTATTWNNQQMQLLPHLETLSLSGMETMSHIWRCNWNNFLNSQQMPSDQILIFHNLTYIGVYRCKRIKYLLSPLMAKHLSNLKAIDIYGCIGMEEVVSSRDDDGDEELTASMFKSTHTTTTLFPQLEELGLIDLPCLQRIHGGGLRGENNKITSSNMAETISTSDYRQFQSSQMDVATMTNPRLTLRDVSMLELHNLKKLHIISCDLLEHIFISSELECLKKLEELTVKKCKAMQVIVKEDGEHTTTSKVVVFRHLKSLTLVDLPNLRSFFLGMNEFEWPLLDKVKIYGCPQMIKFTPGQCITPNLSCIHTGFGIHNLEGGLNFHSANASHETQFYGSTMCSTPGLISLLQFPWSFSNLIDVHVQEHRDELLSRHIVFPGNELLKLQNLEKLQVSGSYEGVTEEVFETIQGTDEDGDVNKSQTVVTFPKLKEVILEKLKELRWIWRSSRLMTLNFPNLTKVSIRMCSRLEYVFTYDTVGSLLQLQELQVITCENMEVIVKQREDYETEVNEIVFPCLKSLKLQSLKSLKGFSLGKEAFRWPSLDTLEIKYCPQITVFTSQESTTPKLKLIETSFGMCDAMEDPNSFIRTMKQEGFKF